MSKTVFALTIGVINIQSGKTQYDWSIYDEFHKDSKLFYCSGGFLMLGAPGSLEIGDDIVIRNNDTQRKMKDATVKAILSTDKDTLIKELLELEFDYRQMRAFKKKAFSRKLSTSYSIKGVTD